jgi:hypothetical protein
MNAWWTFMDLEICCSHEGPDWSSITVGNEERHTAKCPDCGQEYTVELIVIPGPSEIEIPAERLEVLE